ncbi:preprotein translocase subunit SecG [Candidatus Jorgensenbacteria bacterium RIFCSPLOWO2_02_FULL_45_12]|uniref:Protein-export membrane protein SecG n=2 Tax=Candidatus Joergenseniibacteriota TaxID=1752739 RepID=A0A1F6BNJ2_9BACT|nr:MAG: Preprotein translocase, SecG subunit [Candidatus Jorgensenbacteria bacterium GW2011_GWA2_45_9]OGG38494.1 MAG: preprotein translocase subunit SecG [Candidatus Jorgensenbacteria bacterium RIFCSPHIGHO2_02_FULL_45_20]OGG42326.1 MAG: preprotein translocase subunit SecG [Candidatus Jorgensenbacteria bacterium RIFCSPLOWO2_02_FULL_45_12]
MLTIAEIIVSVILIALVLVQERSSGLSGVFGGGGDASYQTRRGMERGIFISTIVLAFVFAALAVAKLMF